jgi:integrase/recombinase XerC
MNEIVKTQYAIEPTITIRLDQNPAAVYIARLGTKNSRYSMRWCLNIAASILSNGDYDCLELDWARLKYQHLAALKSKLIGPNPTSKRSKPYGFGTVNMIISGVKGVIREGWKMGLIEDPDYLRIMAETSIRGESLPAGRAVSHNEIKLLFDVCRANGPVNGSRDLAMLAVMIGAGLRRTEVAELDLDDWKSEDQLLVVRQGKGRRAREVPIGTKVNRAIKAWVVHRGQDAGPLFLAVHKGDATRNCRLRPEGVYFMLERRSRQAGVDKVSPHDLRRTYITNLLSNGNDLASVAKLAGHKSVETTAIYDRRGLESLREAVESLDLPT